MTLSVRIEVGYLLGRFVQRGARDLLIPIRSTQNERVGREKEEQM